jgi:diguanylate cyclase (GGDEF)-like protein/PAS domain S-box-containing protein
VELAEDDAGLPPHLAALEGCEEPLPRDPPSPTIKRALLALSLVAADRAEGAAGPRRRLRHLLGPERYACWVEAVLVARTWGEWLRSYPEIDFTIEAALAGRFEALCRDMPRLRAFALAVDDAVAPVSSSLAQSDMAARWRVDADTVHTGIIQVGLDGEVIMTNTEARRMYGVDEGGVASLTIRDLEGLMFWEDGTLCPVEDYPAMRCLATLRPQGPQVLGHRRQDGEMMWATYTATPLLDPQTREAVGVTLTVVDITDRKRAEAALEATEHRYRLLVDASDSMIVLFGPSGAILAANETAAGYVRVPAEGLIGKTLHELLPDAGLADAYLARNLQVLETGEGLELEEMLEIAGELRWFSTRLRPVRDFNGNIYAVQALVRDITRRRRAEIALREREELARHESLHDPLTRLPNRVLLRDRLEVEVVHAKRHPEYLFAVLCLDLDRFKNIHDSLGHSIGDQLLIEFSRRLLETIGPEDTLARTGGDEFAILVKDLHEPTDALKLADRVLGILQQPFSVGDQQIYTPTSIGIALSSTDYDRPEDILRDADTAMFRAKSRGKNRYEIFDKGMHREAVELLVLENDLRRAIRRDEFRLYYQPVVELATGDLAGFEALLRWEHPTRGLVSPGDFIAFAEETGIIISIGEWVLQEACQQMQRWHQRYPLDPQLTISVNLSGKQFAQPALIAKALRETSLDPATLKLEITESVIMEDPRAASTLLQELQGQQIQSYVDDFGTGYSSLSYLHRFPMSAVKIDRSFVAEIGPQGENAEIVRTIVDLAHNLGMKVIAEGVETEEQRRLLLAFGCEFAQGYFFSPPIEPRRAEALIAETFERRRRDPANAS